MRKLVAVLGMVGLAMSGLEVSARADDAAGYDDVLGGFDEEADTSAYFDDAEGDEGDSDAAEKWWDLQGAVSLTAAYAFHDHKSVWGPCPKECTDWEGLTRLRPKLWLELDTDLPGGWQTKMSGFAFYDFAYLIEGRNDFSDEVLNDYEYDWEIQDFWAGGKLTQKLDAKLGRQVIRWGRSDSLRVLDVMTPIDNRDPGLTDLEDIFRPVTAARLDYYLGNWSLSGVLVPETRYDVTPAFGSDFFPAIEVGDVLGAMLGVATDPGGNPIDLDAFDLGSGGQGIQIPGFSATNFREERPDKWNEHMEYGAWLTGIYSGWDLSFYVARYWANNGHPELYQSNTFLPIPAGSLSQPGDPPPPMPPVDLLVEVPGVKLRYDRLTLVGTGGNLTVGSWLFKTELAYIHGLRFTVFDQVIVDPGGLPVQFTNIYDRFEKDRLDVMGAVEYYGFSDIMLSVELVNRHLFGHEKSLKSFPNYVKEDQLELALRGTADFWNDTLHATVVGVLFDIDGGGGSIVRLELDYDVMDALELKGGVMFYQSGDLIGLKDIGDNDRIYLSAKYSF